MIDWDRNIGERFDGKPRAIAGDCKWAVDSAARLLAGTGVIKMYLIARDRDFDFNGNIRTRPAGRLHAFNEVFCLIDTIRNAANRFAH